jgi:hypothetical protein
MKKIHKYLIGFLATLLLTASGTLAGGLGGFILCFIGVFCCFILVEFNYIKPHKKR